MNDFDDEIEDFEDDAPAKKVQGLGRVRMALARWWVILLFGILGYAVALYSLSISEPTHEATGVLEVITTEQLLVGQGLEMDKLGADKSMTTIANKLVGPGQLTKVVNSPKVQSIEKAVPPSFSLKPKYWRTPDEMTYTSAANAETSDVVDMITSNVQVLPRQGTTLIDVIVTHKDSQAAMTIVDAIMEAYIETESKRKTGGATDAYKTLRTEANEASRDLETAQRSMESYKSVMLLNERLKTKRDELVLLKQRYRGKHPKMIQATALNDELNRRFRREINAVIQSPSELEFWAPYQAQLDNYSHAVQQSKVELQNAIDIGAAQSEPALMEKLEQSQQNWLSLVRGALSARSGWLASRIANKQALYDSCTKRIAEINVTEENDEGEIKISERAYASGNVTTDKYMRLGQGVAGGLMLGFGIAYLLAMVDYKIYDVRSVEEATDLPCLAAIPDGAVFDLEEEWTNVLEAEPRTANAESIRNLRAAVMLLGKAERRKTIVVTSAVPGEGKTTVASELAAAFAQNDQKTLLIDLDMRKPRVHTLFPYLNHEIGMTNVLTGQAELSNAIQKTKVKNLSTILAGAKAPNPSELIQEVELENVMKTVSQYYDRIIIDTPPVLPVSDTRLLVRYSQSVILVVRALKAPVGAVMRAKELLVQAKAPMSGVVINAMKRKHLGSGYYGYRGYGEYGGSGGYGGYYEDDE